MAIKPAWHSLTLKQTVHHNNSKCNIGNNIEKESQRTGTGGHPLCEQCKWLGSKTESTTWPGKTP